MLENLNGEVVLPVDLDQQITRLENVIEEYIRCMMGDTDDERQLKNIQKQYEELADKIKTKNDVRLEVILASLSAVEARVGKKVESAKQRSRLRMEPPSISIVIESDHSDTHVVQHNKH